MTSFLWKKITGPAWIRVVLGSAVIGGVLLSALYGVDRWYGGASEYKIMTYIIGFPFFFALGFAQDLRIYQDSGTWVVVLGAYFFTGLVITGCLRLAQLLMSRIRG